MHYSAQPLSPTTGGRATPPGTPDRQWPQAVQVIHDVELPLSQSAVLTPGDAPLGFQDSENVDVWNVEPPENDITDETLESIATLARAEEAAAVANAAVAAARTAAQAAAQITSVVSPATPRRTGEAVGRNVSVSPLRSPFTMHTPRLPNHRVPVTASGSSAIHTDLMPIVARSVILIPQRPSSIPVIPSSRYIGDIKISDILARPELSMEAGAHIINNPLQLNFFSVHSAHLKDSDARNRFASQALRSAEANVRGIDYCGW